MKSILRTIRKLWDTVRVRRAQRRQRPLTLTEAEELLRLLQQMKSNSNKTTTELP
jgi:hypothetical protein